ncbi:metal-dependent hydrolase [Acidovorax lacteus]|uniref:Metal-dependent hydrolase n=1 Tax=Acidovorax lacteus TaxID=1924988 RepID=A0ABP8L242_9BURK
MTHLTVRRLLIDLEAPFDRHWCGNDAFRTALFNALSMSFPVGEQFFMDAVRNGYQALPPEAQARFADEVKGFVGQEATHRRIHSLFNHQLERQGLVNDWGPRAAARVRLFEGTDPRHALAVTAANEHFTALLAEWVLGHPEVLAGAEARLAMMWQWHCAEEAEHKSTALDLYQALGGNHAWRITWFRRISVLFVADVLRQTVLNLRRDGTLWRWATWKSAARTLLGRGGLVRESWRPWRDYLRRDFHPSQQPSDRSDQWLAANRDQYQPVGGH